jgi:hypothetical protein
LHVDTLPSTNPLLGVFAKLVKRVIRWKWPLSKGKSTGWPMPICCCKMIADLGAHPELITTAHESI